MIEINKLTKKFGQFIALDSISVKITEGESVCLLGENGAGKSTLIKCILGMLDYSGEIYVNNEEIKVDTKKHKFNIGYIPQEPVFYDMTIKDIISFFGILRNASKEKIKESIEITGLQEHENKLTSELSGGLKQRLSFAIALISDPSILILDEPTSNLDASARLDLINLVKRLKETGKTVLFSSHRLDEVDFLADRVYVLKRGKVVYEGLKENLINKLGLKTKIILSVDKSITDSALNTLRSNGFEIFSQNGYGLSVQINNNEKLQALRKILDSDIKFNDLSIETPSMEEIISSL